MSIALDEEVAVSPVAQAVAGGHASAGATIARRARQLLGAALVVLGTLPVYRLLSGRETGIAGEVVTQVADVYLSLLWSGTVVFVLVALLAGWLLPPSAVHRIAARGRATLLAPPLPWLAFGAALCTVALASAFTLLVLEGKPSIIDAIVQMLHARYWAAGRLAGPGSFMNEFWHIQNSLITPRGWVSQYPPGHVLLLALGFRAGAVWLVGPLLAGVTVFFTVLAAARLLPDRPATARLGGLLLALSPFLICLAGSFMNHITSAAAFAVALYCGVRARDGRAAWAIGTGAALGYAFAVRPLSALAVGAALCVAVWLASPSAADARRFAGRLAFAAAGALPFVAALLAYNAYFFGGPTKFGYRAALGSAMSLGFHRDPWGNVYGPVEALAYTASDLLTLGVNLLETPVSAVLIVGIYLMVARRISSGTRVFAAWALVLVAASVLYWHHGIYMGPRMLLEASPGWMLLTTVAGVDLASRLVPAHAAASSRFSPRTGLAGAFALALLWGLLITAPTRASSYGGDWIPIARIEVPRVERPSLIFVHDAWTGRIGMQLAVAGMTLDSVETLIRQNSTCAVHHAVDDLVSPAARRRAYAYAQLDVQPRATDLPTEIILSPGDKMRAWPGEKLTGDCVREARSDSRGILDIAPLLWQGDLPGVDQGGALFVRDLGPEANARLIAALPDREPLFYFLYSPHATPVLASYDEAIREVWGTKPTRH